MSLKEKPDRRTPPLILGRMDMDDGTRVEDVLVRPPYEMMY